MSYSGYSRNEYTSEVDAILSEKYAGKPRADYRIYSIYDSAYREGVSPAVAARRVAFASRLRRKEKYWLETGPKIENGYAYSKRVGSRKDWLCLYTPASGGVSVQPAFLPQNLSVMP